MNRVSEGNINHIETLIRTLTSNCGPDAQIVKCFNTVFEQMQASLRKGELYFCHKSELKPLLEPASAMTYPKMVALINRGCGSACLDFLDGLKKVHPDVKFIGEPTGKDSVYMEVREVPLPSGEGTLGFPIKVYRNRPRGHNEPHKPDIVYEGDLEDLTTLHPCVEKQFEKIDSSA